MPNENPDQDMQRIVRNLTDRERLSRQGISDEWIQSCADLVGEFQDLQQRFRNLEAQVSPSESESSQDTLLL